MDLESTPSRTRRYLAFSNESHNKIGPLFNQTSFCTFLEYPDRTNLPSIFTSYAQFTHFYDGLVLHKDDISNVNYVSFHPPGVNGSLQNFIKALSEKNLLVRTANIALANVRAILETPHKEDDEIGVESEEVGPSPVPNKVVENLNEEVVKHLTDAFRKGEHSVGFTDGSHTHKWFRFSRKYEGSEERLDRRPASTKDVC